MHTSHSIHNRLLLISIVSVIKYKKRRRRNRNYLTTTSPDIGNRTKPTALWIHLGHVRGSSSAFVRVRVAMRHPLVTMLTCPAHSTAGIRIKINTAGRPSVVYFQKESREPRAAIILLWYSLFRKTFPLFCFIFIRSFIYVKPERKRGSDKTTHRVFLVLPFVSYSNHLFPFYTFFGFVVFIFSHRPTFLCL